MADAPLLPEDQRYSPAGGPASSGSGVTCPRCQQVTKADSVEKSPPGLMKEDEGYAEPGPRVNLAAGIRMSILCAARLTYSDLLRAVANLTCHLTERTADF
jgi:hypothetical protein